MEFLIDASNWLREEEFCTIAVHILLSAIHK